MNVLVVVGKARTEVPRHVRPSIIDVYYVSTSPYFYLLCTTPTPLHYLMCILVADIYENRFLRQVKILGIPPYSWCPGLACETGLNHCRV
jgi:hypothetical protein